MALVLTPRRRAFVNALSSLLLATGAAMASAERQPGEAAASQVHTRRGGPRLRVVAEARTEVQPKSVALSPDGRQLWVCHFGRVDRDNVWVFDPEDLSLLGRVEFTGNGVETAFHPDGRRAFVSNFRRGLVHEIDRESFAILREFRVARNPKTLVVSPDGGLLYVASYTSARVSVVDLVSGEVQRELPTGEQPRGMAILPDGRLLVASFRSDFVQLFAPDGEELRRFDTCRFPRHLQLAPAPLGLHGASNASLFVTCTLGSVGVYDLFGQRLAVAPTGRNPRSLDVSADGRWAATANFGSSDVTLVDLAELHHRTAEVEGSNQLVGLALDASPDRVRVWATSWRNRRLYALEAPVPRAPRAAGRAAEPSPSLRREPTRGSSGGGARSSAAR